MTFDPGSESYTAARLAFELRGAVFPMYIPTPNPQPETQKFAYFEVEHEPTFSIYPNPANRYLRINSHIETNTRFIFVLYDNTGKTIVDKELIKENEDALIELPELSTGTYSYSILNIEGHKIDSGNVMIQQK